MKYVQKYRLILVVFCLMFTIQQCSKKEPPPPPPPPPPNPPVLSSVDPISGYVGDFVTINGINLADADAVNFGSIKVKIFDVSSAGIKAVVPPGSAVGVNVITVHSPAGTSNGLSFTVNQEPEHVDSLPPTIVKTTPTNNYTGYSVLIYGDNLSGVIKITFNDKEAQIYTNNRKVVTTFVPDGIPQGAATIKITTRKGTATTSFQVLGAPTSSAPPISFSIITLPPPNYVVSISNQWSCGLLRQNSGDSTFVDPNSGDGVSNFTTTGFFEYDYDKAKSYNDINYVEFTNQVTGETFAGQFSSKFNNPCVLHMVLISSKTGLVDTCIFNLRDNFPEIVCEE